MAKSPYTSRKLLNELKKLEKESEDVMLTHNLHDIAINGKKVGCSGHITNIFNKRCVYVNTEKVSISLFLTKTLYVMRKMKETIRQSVLA